MIYVPNTIDWSKIQNKPFVKIYEFSGTLSAGTVIDFTNIATTGKIFLFLLNFISSATSLILYPNGNSYTDAFKVINWSASVDGTSGISTSAGVDYITLTDSGPGIPYNIAEYAWLFPKVWAMIQMRGITDSSNPLIFSQRLFMSPSPPTDWTNLGTLENRDNDITLRLAIYEISH